MSEYKAWMQNEVGPFTNLKIGNMAMPSRGDNEVLIETKAATLNFADLPKDLISTDLKLYSSLGFRACFYPRNLRQSLSRDHKFQGDNSVL